MTTPLYKQAKAPIEDRVSDLLSRMTIEEKVGQMVQLAAKFEHDREKLEEWNIGSYLHCTEDMPNELQLRAEKTRLGIPLIFGIDAIHGHCFENDATVFPSQLAISCSWNPDLIKLMGEVTAREVRACGIHWTFSPVLCVARDLRWGRVNETFGEDPWLIGELARSLIQGYQGENFADDNSILACAKHFAGYGESVGGRDAYEAEVSKRKMLALFLPPFEKVVSEAKVASLMAGYQAIDGVPCSANRWLLHEVPREQWKMEGFIVTDWDNVGTLVSKQRITKNIKEATFLAIQAGNDMIMSTPKFYEAAVSLVKEGRIDETTIDSSVKRILRYKFKLGLFDKNRYVTAQQKEKIIGCIAHWQAALEASRQSITLLKNNNVLPLSNKNTRDILLVGPNADDIFAQLGDWSFGSNQAGATNDDLHQKATKTIFNALLGYGQQHNINVNYIKGADCEDETFNEIELAVKAAKSSDVVIACVGDTLNQLGEFHDRADLSLSATQLKLLKAIKDSGKPLIVVFVASKPLSISWIKENADALLCCFNPGAKGGIAITEALFGQLNPSGKLTISFPHSAGQLPVYYNHYQGWHAANSPLLNGEERYIDLPKEPLFCFGEGLSYTQFEYSQLTIHNPILHSGETLRFSITLKNSGALDGVEIVQAYVNDLVSSVTTPVLNLRAFKRVFLQAGEQKIIDLEITFNDLALVNTNLEYVVEAGEFELFVGASSKRCDLLKTKFEVV